jgi:hypothetical protein
MTAKFSGRGKFAWQVSDRLCEYGDSASQDIVQVVVVITVTVFLIILRMAFLLIGFSIAVSGLPNMTFLTN